MKTTTAIGSDENGKAPCEIEIRKGNFMKALSRAFSDFHRARSVLEDPDVIDDETATRASRDADDAIARIICTPSPVAWRVWSKIQLLDWLMTEEGGGLQCHERFALRMIGSIKADLEHLGIGEGQ